MYTYYAAILQTVFSTHRVMEGFTSLNYITRPGPGGLVMRGHIT